MHPTIVTSVDAWKTFLQECEFLKVLKHPHIVQYLGTSKDPDTGSPVLIMEYIRENLSQFLERHSEPLPFHTQVNICHDIALALVYLHSKGIIHHDLSSSNVLIAGSLAKISDFGVSKIISLHPRTTPLSLNQGTMVYMPPEVELSGRFLNSPSVNIDCFSYGVLGIQIVTRHFPDPGRSVHVKDDPQQAVGVIFIPIPDAERRKSDIDLIDPAHPLLDMFLACISYRQEDRPSMKDICQILTGIKKRPFYIGSTSASDLFQSSTVCVERETQVCMLLEEKDKHIKQLQIQLKACMNQLERHNVEILIPGLHRQHQYTQQESRQHPQCAALHQDETPRLSQPLLDDKPLGR